MRAKSHKLQKNKPIELPDDLMTTLRFIEAKTGIPARSLVADILRDALTPITDGVSRLKLKGIKDEHTK